MKAANCGVNHLVNIAQEQGLDHTKENLKADLSAQQRLQQDRKYFLSLSMLEKKEFTSIDTHPARKASGQRSTYLPDVTLNAFTRYKSAALAGVPAPGS